MAYQFKQKLQSILYRHRPFIDFISFSQLAGSAVPFNGSKDPNLSPSDIGVSSSIHHGFYQPQPNDTSPPFSGQVMYSLSTYNYGSPGYYNNPLQYPISHDTQTSPTYVPRPDTNIHVHHVPQVIDTPPTAGIPTHPVTFAAPLVPLFLGAMINHLKILRLTSKKGQMIITPFIHQIISSFPTVLLLILFIIKCITKTLVVKFHPHS
jgi:hypothetical protein